MSSNQSTGDEATVRLPTGHGVRLAFRLVEDPADLDTALSHVIGFEVSTPVGVAAQPPHDAAASERVP